MQLRPREPGTTEAKSDSTQDFVATRPPFLQSAGRGRTGKEEEGAIDAFAPSILMAIIHYPFPPQTLRTNERNVCRLYPTVGGDHQELGDKCWTLRRRQRIGRELKAT